MKWAYCAVVLWLCVACAPETYPGFKKVAPGLFQQLVAFDHENEKSDTCAVYEVYVSSPDSLLNATLKPKTQDNLPVWLKPSSPQLNQLWPYLQHMQPGDSAVFIDENIQELHSDSVGVLQLWWKACYNQKDFDDMYAHWLSDRELREGDRLRKFALENGFVSSIVHPAVLFKIEASGDGKRSTYGDLVSILYRGMFLNGEVFDDMQSHKMPLTFELGEEGQVLIGLEYGLVGVRAGEVRHVVVPSVFGFGERGSSGIVPPYTPLWYRVEILPVDSLQP